MIDSEQLGKIFDTLSIGTNIRCYSIIADERISKPTHPRYTEASLVKQLKQLNIGRPATFASMVAKVQERQYADIRSIDGAPVTLRTSEYSYPDKIHLVMNESVTGADNNKLMPTQLGRMINDFLNAKFAEFMDYTFTARVETMLDEIATGKLNWVIVVDTVYKTIKPTIDELAVELAKVAKERQVAGKEGDLTPKYSQYDTILGENPSNGHTIAITQTRFGYAICERHPSNKKLHKYANFTGSPDNMTLKQALALLVYPRNLGEYEGVDILLCRAKSIYIKYGERNFSIDIFNKSFPDHAISDIPNTTYEQACNLVKLTIDNNIKVAGGAGDINLTPEIVIKPTGRYGPYIKYQGVHNIALGKPILKKYDSDVSKITVDDCNILIGKFMAKKQQGGSGSGSSGGTDLTAKFKAGSGAKSAGASSKIAEKPKRKVAVRKETVKKEDTDGVKPKKVVVRKKKE
jgi:DNA topoisomerase-1